MRLSIVGRMAVIGILVEAFCVCSQSFSGDDIGRINYNLFQHDACRGQYLIFAFYLYHHIMWNKKLHLYSCCVSLSLMIDNINEERLLSSAVLFA